MRNQQTTVMNPFVQSLANRSGFTLTEMLIVIALIALVGTFATTQLIDRYQSARVDSTKIKMSQVGTALDQFKLDCGMYPDTDQGLDALVSKPEGGRECKKYNADGYVKSAANLKDGFDNDFIYESDGRKYEIISLGADGAEGGEGHDADISSKDL